MPRHKRKHKQVFTLFPKLPLEIQSLIWDFCMPKHHVVKVQVPNDTNYKTVCYRNAVINLRRLPHVARVCHEARRAALRRDARRRAYTIADPERKPKPDDPRGPACRVPFDVATDVIYLSSVPAPVGSMQTQHGTTEAPHLSTLLPSRDVAVCVPTGFVQRSPEILREMAGHGRRNFHLALGREFVVHMPRGKALSRGLFGHGGDETTVMVEAGRFDEFASYELAYNMTRRGDDHGELRFLIARSLTGWVEKWDELRLEALATLARKRIEDAWVGLQGDGRGRGQGHTDAIHDVEEASDVLKDDVFSGMPVPIPVVLFRLCVKCRHG